MVMLTAPPGQMFETQWPHLWSLLKTSSKRTLPAALRDYISGPEAAVGEAHLNSLESSAAELVSILGYTEVAAAYRRDLSALTSEQQFAEFACELSICTALSRVAEANSVRLRPAIPGQRKRPDIRAAFSRCEVFAEVKRYHDKGPGEVFADLAELKRHNDLPGRNRGENGRSIFLRTGPSLPAKPRMMALVSKLEDVPDQLPNNAINILFLFHSSFGESQRYIQQALFGETTFFDVPGSVTISDRAALFARTDWRKVSAVAFVSYCNNALHCQELWQNPQASVAIPDTIHPTIRNFL